MHPGEPHLLNAGRLRFSFLLLIPGNWPERGALIVKRQRMPRTVDVAAQLEIVDRHAVGFDRVPQAEECDRDILAPRFFDLSLHSRKNPTTPAPVVQPDQAVAHQAPNDDKRAPGLKACRPEASVGGRGIVGEFLLRAEGHEAGMVHEADEHADRKCAAAEAEGVDGRTILVGNRTDAAGGTVWIITAQEFVERQNILLDAPTSCAADRREDAVGRGADTVGIDAELLRVALVERLEDAPHISLFRAARTIAGAISEQYEFASHNRPPGNAFINRLIIGPSGLSR